MSELLLTTGVPACHRRRNGMDNIRNERKHGPRWTSTWWGERTTAVNIGIVIVVFLIILWRTLLP